MRKILIYIGIALAAIGCSEVETTNKIPASCEINLSAGVATRLASDDDCAWKLNDEVGIFTDQSDENNLLFTIFDTGTGELENKCETSLYTLISGTRTYYAYHPYDSEQSTTSINIDCTTDQSKPLLWATTTSNYADVSLQFAHKYAKVQFSLVAGGVDVTSLDSATAWLTGANSIGSFNINSGEFTITATDDIALNIDSDSTITAYLPPMESVAGNVKLCITAGGNTFSKNIPTEKWESGSLYEYGVTVGELPPTLAKDYAADPNASTYTIYSADDLRTLSDIVNGTGDYSDNAYTFNNVTITLIKDVDLGGIDKTGNVVAENEFTAIGTITNPFGGIFDGGGFKVSGLYINKPNDDNQGLFGYAGAEYSKIEIIKNLTVAGQVTGKENVGGVAGYCYRALLLSNCHNTATIKGETYVGGIVGYNKDSDCTYCYNLGKVTGSGNYVGGIFGYARWTAVTYCYNSCEVTGGGNHVGGIFGCSSYATITNCCNKSKIEGVSFVAGISGENNGKPVTNCYNTGEVIGSNRVIGGIIGLSWQYNNVENCYNWAKITGNRDVGGIVGQNSYKVSNCYNTGEVIGDVKGGIAALNDNSTNATVTNCYYNNSVITIGIGEFDTDDNAMTLGMKDATMKEASFVTTLNSNTETGAWTAVTNNYPILSWQVE